MAIDYLGVNYNSIDYRDLLVRYMEHVAVTEGTDCIGQRKPGEFSTEEWEVLQKMSGELFEKLRG